jgi:hypothetical protein
MFTHTHSLKEKTMKVVVHNDKARRVDPLTLGDLDDGTAFRLSITDQWLVRLHVIESTKTDIQPLVSVWYPDDNITKGHLTCARIRETAHSEFHVYPGTRPGS